VKAIRSTPNMLKEQLVTLLPLEKEPLDVETLKKVKKELDTGKKTSVAISAIPVTKKLPYMTITNIPDELI
jgi:hypothetical protein